MWDKLRKTLYDGCDILEIGMAIIVGISILMAIVGILPGLAEYWFVRSDAHEFMEFLDAILNIVIGIEFLKMLCKPSTANIIEALIFLIARHMIIQTTTAVEDMISVISICTLFVFRRFMLATKPDKEQNVPNVFRAIKLSQSPEFRAALIRYEKEEAEKERVQQQIIEENELKGVLCETATNQKEQEKQGKK